MLAQPIGNNIPSKIRVTFSLPTLFFHLKKKHTRRIGILFLFILVGCRCFDFFLWPVLWCCCFVSCCPVGDFGNGRGVGATGQVVVGQGMVIAGGKAKAGCEVTGIRG